MATLDFSRTVAAPPETLFDVLSDHRGYPRYSRFRRVELEREGQPEPDGAGAIRALHLLGPPLREEIIDFEPPRLMRYRLLSGAPLRDHVGTIELTPAGEGTRMRYRIETHPTLPLLGGMVLAVARRSVEDLVAGLAAEAERRALSGA